MLLRKPAPGLPGNLSVAYVPILELKLSAKNPRTHSKKQIEQIARSIGEFGFVNPVLVDHTGTLVAGHGRVEAAKSLGIETVPTIRIDHLGEAQLQAYMIADNQLAALAGWDDEILKINFEEILTAVPDFDLTFTGFEIPEIDLIILGNQEGEEEQEEDLESLLQQDPVSKKGDLWILGSHRLLCGDALERADYARVMDGGKAQLVFTDPPYNVKIENAVGLGKKKHAEFAMASGEQSSAEFTAFLQTACANMAEFSVDGSVHFIFMDWRHAGELLAAGEAVYDEQLNLCVWNKTNGGMGSLYRSKHEFVFVFKNGKAPHINNVQLGKHGRYRVNVWDYAGQNTFHPGRENELGAHPTVKPVQLVADAILDCSKRNGTVLDPFGGSGTTLIAAENTGRQARLVEYEPTYVDVAIRRWQLHTGQVAVHADTGKTFDQLAKEMTHG
jgi:DNA modification methylase